MITRFNLSANRELFHAVSLTKRIYHGVTKLIIFIIYNRSISTSNLKGVSVRFANVTDEGSHAPEIFYHMLLPCTCFINLKVEIYYVLL